MAGFFGMIWLLSCVIMGVNSFPYASNNIYDQKSIDIFPSASIPGYMPDVGPEECSIGFGNATMCVNVTVPTLVPFLLPKTDVQNSAIIIAPGGGFSALSYSNEGTDVAKWLNTIGISAFVLKYRVPAAFGYTETPLMDAQRALRLVRSRAAQMGLNASRIGFMGFSAGGDLAAATASNFEVSQYPAIDKVDAITARPDFSLMIYPAVHEWGANITSKHPPAFFTQAEHDPAVSSALTTEYYLTLRNKSSSPSDLHLFHGDIHGYGMCNTRDSKGRIPALVAPSEGTSGPTPAWVPWIDACVWPDLAKAFLCDIGLIIL